MVFEREKSRRNEDCASYSQQKRHRRTPGKTVVKLEARVLNLEADWLKNH
jgi:hypothetical protein